MTSASREQRFHPAWWTAIIASVVIAFVWLCSMLFVGGFTSYVKVTLTSDRAGLMMESGAKVKMRGVQVGRVAGVKAGSQPVRVQLELFPSQIDYIPANAQAEIRATTLFGEKYVELIAPQHPAAQHISAGAVVKSRNVATEVNTVFQNLVNVLHQIDPPKLNAVLTAVADALRGQGDRIGQATTATNHVLSALNPRMDTLGKDWQSLGAASDAYSTAAQHILSILDSATTVSSTVVNNTDSLDTLLLDTIGFSQAGIDLLGPNRSNLAHAINALEPTTSLLQKYYPEYTCLLMGAKWFVDNSRDVFAGDGRTSILDDGLLFGDDSYRYPDNLPIVAAKGGPGGQPGCGSLPDVSKNFPVRELVTNTGWGTGLGARPNPGIGHPWWVDFFPVTRGIPRPPSIRGMGPPAIGPVPYPGAPPYGAPQYGPDGTRLYPLPPGPPPAQGTP